MHLLLVRASERSCVWACATVARSVFQIGLPFRIQTTEVLRVAQLSHGQFAEFGSHSGFRAFKPFALHNCCMANFIILLPVWVLECSSAVICLTVERPTSSSSFSLRFWRLLGACRCKGFHELQKQHPENHLSPDDD